MTADAFRLTIPAAVGLAIVLALFIAAPLWARHTDRRNHR